MSGQPDPKPEPRERRARRARDPLAVKQATLADRECWGCGRDGANGHHLIPKDWTVPGPDEPWNIISLCGTGTARCHGAYHGNPYSVEGTGRNDVKARITPHHVRRRIAERLVSPAEKWRLEAICEHLGPTLAHRFFFRQLQLEVKTMRIENGKVVVYS